MSNRILSCVDLTMSYAVPDGELVVFSGLNFDVNRGEIVTITGESGEGKSTLLHLLGGLDRPVSGTIVVDGRDLTSMTERDLAAYRNQKIGFVFQFHYLLPDFTALENAAMPMLMAGKPRTEAERAAESLLRAVGLDKRLEHRPSELSGGEQQRVAVARALVNEPAIVLADEPSGNLDYRHSMQLHDLVWSLAREREATFIIATHDRELALRADREITLEAGEARELPHADRASYLKKAQAARGSDSEP